MTLLKEIGAILGFVAFGGMAVLAFLTFQQARHVRRLREWAGRSPERAAVEAERVAGAASEATIARAGGLEEPPEDKGPGRLHRLGGEIAYRWEELDRRSPVDPKLLVAGLVAVIVGVGILTSGFGLVGGSTEATSETATAPTAGAQESDPVKVAVLNGTAPEGGVGVPGIADKASAFVEDAGFKVGNVDDAPSVEVSLIMYAEGFDAEAEQLAADLEGMLSATDVVPMTPEIQDIAGRADLALIVGQDDQGIS